MAEEVNNPAPKNEQTANDASDSLESPSQTSSPSSSNPDNDEGAKVTTEDLKDQPRQNLKSGPLHRIFGRFNPYIFVLVLLVMIAVIVVMIGYFGSLSSTNAKKLVSQNLSSAALQQLANNDTNVGSSNQVLNVESSAIFYGNVLARQALQVAGNLTVGGTLALNNLSVNGAGQFDQLNVSKNLSVAGDSNVQGNASVSKNLQVNGGTTFGSTISAPQVTTSILQLNGNLSITHHIDTGGSIPTVKGESNLGPGGTASLSGSDTSGYVSINSGNPTAAGCFATITFASPFTKTPYIQVTPVGASAGGLGYYITRTSSSFSICASSAPPANGSFGFDYFALD